MDMQEANHLAALQGAVAYFEPSMSTYHREHRAYKFQMDIDDVFHPAVITQPPVTLTSQMVAVYYDEAPPLEGVNRQLLNLVEVYEHNRSGWAFSHFASLQLTLWQLDPLRARLLSLEHAMIVLNRLYCQECILRRATIRTVWKIMWSTLVSTISLPWIFLYRCFVCRQE